MAPSTVLEQHAVLCSAGLTPPLLLGWTKLLLLRLCACWRAGGWAGCQRAGVMRAGALAGKAEAVAAVRSMHNVLGGTIDPHAAYLMLRGMKTLDVRVQRQNQVWAPSTASICGCCRCISECTGGVCCLPLAAELSCMVEGLYLLTPNLLLRQPASSPSGCHV